MMEPVQGRHAENRADWLNCARQAAPPFPLPEGNFRQSHRRSHPRCGHAILHPLPAISVPLRLQSIWTKAVRR